MLVSTAPAGDEGIIPHAALAATGPQEADARSYLGRGIADVGTYRGFVAYKERGGLLIVGLLPPEIARLSLER